MQKKLHQRQDRADHQQGLVNNGPHFFQDGTPAGEDLCGQCVGAGSGRIRNYLQDPDPQFEFRIRIRKGSGIRFMPTN